jgi:hypothetical protein
MSCLSLLDDEVEIVSVKGLEVDENNGWEEKTV